MLRIVLLGAACAAVLVFFACGDDRQFETPPPNTTTSSSVAGTGGGAGAPGVGGSGGTPCVDGDMDGTTDCEGDCDDADPNVHPGMLELCGDGLDNDCDGNGDPPGQCMGLGTYVSALTGDDVSGDGTKMNPVQTIAKGVQNAQTINNGQPVFVAEGIYPEKVNIVEGVDLLGGHQCDASQCSFDRDPSVYVSLIANIDKQGVYAGHIVTRATSIDGFTVQGMAGNPGSASRISAITVDQGTPTIANNVILGGQVTGCSECISDGIVVLGPSNASQGVLIEQNLILGGSSSDETYGITLQYASSLPIAEITENDIRGGTGRFTRAVNAFHSGAGTLITNNRIASGTLGSNSPINSFALLISGDLTLDGNHVNTDPTLVGTCIFVNSLEWCGGIESIGATATITNNVVVGMPSPRSVGLYISEGEVPFGLLVVNGNTFDGGGAPNQLNGVSTALACETKQGQAAQVGNIRNNILRGGSSTNRFGFFEDDQQNARTCEPTFYENNDIWFTPQINTTNTAHRQWTSTGFAVPLVDVTAVNMLPYAQNNVQVDPLLDSTFHLDNASPCIDAGTATEAPASDFDGEVRPQGNGIDIGADEAS